MALPWFATRRMRANYQQPEHPAGSGGDATQLQMAAADVDAGVRFGAVLGSAAAAGPPGYAYQMLRRLFPTRPTVEAGTAAPDDALDGFGVFSRLNGRHF